MQPNDDLVIQIFFWTFASIAVVEAMKATGWRILAFGILGGSLVLIGVSWPWLKELYPPFTNWITSIATNPQSWFFLFVLFFVLVAFTGRSRKTRGQNGPTDHPTTEALNNALQGLFERVGRIEQLPSAATVDEHNSLKTTTISFMKDYLARDDRTIERVNELMGRLDAIENKMSVPVSHPETDRDLLLLMHFMVYQSTVLMLDDLLKSSPEGIFDGPLQLGGDFELKNSQSVQFIASARSKLDHGSFRRSELENTLRLAEGEAEMRLEATPVDQRPTGIDPLALRRWTITHLQCAWAIEFLRRQRSDAEGNLLNQRHGLLERYRIRNPN